MCPSYVFNWTSLMFWVIFLRSSATRSFKAFNAAFLFLVASVSHPWSFLNNLGVTYLLVNPSLSAGFSFAYLVKSSFRYWQSFPLSPSGPMWYLLSFAVRTLSSFVIVTLFACTAHSPMSLKYWTKKISAASWRTHRAAPCHRSCSPRPKCSMHIWRTNLSSKGKMSWSTKKILAFLVTVDQKQCKQPLVLVSPNSIRPIYFGRLKRLHAHRLYRPIDKIDQYTNLWKGNFRIRISVEDWCFLISMRAAIPASLRICFGFFRKTIFWSFSPALKELFFRFFDQCSLSSRAFSRCFWRKSNIFSVSSLPCVLPSSNHITNARNTAWLQFQTVLQKCRFDQLLDFQISRIFSANFGTFHEKIG